MTNNAKRRAALAVVWVSIASVTMAVTKPVFGQEFESATVPAIGLRKQLLVDDYVIAGKTNVTRELGQVTKANGGKPVLVADQPWENANTMLIGSVIHDEGKFRMFYKANYGGSEPGDPPGMPGLLVAYAESTDGVRWTKPKLGIRTFQGNKDNNLITPMGMTCLLDPHETDPQHRYKAAYTHSPKIMACLAHSPDGLHWAPYNKGEPVTHRAADTINQILWDEDAKAYRLYTRTDYQGKLRAKIEVRGTRDMINPDIKADPTGWTTIREWHFDREAAKEYERRQIYSLNGWLYEGVQFGLLWSYEWPTDLSEGSHDLFKRHERDIMNFFILTTRGDEPWDLRWVYANKPLIPRGPDGSFDKDWVQPAVTIVTWQDKHWFYYSGAMERHNRGKEGRPSAMGLAKLRLDGFVCLEAKGKPGTVVTKPFKLEGSKLEVNVDAKMGSVLVEVLDARGKSIPGFSGADATEYAAVDELRLQPRWKSDKDLTALKGQVVRLRLALENARFYSFKFSD